MKTVKNLNSGETRGGRHPPCGAGHLDWSHPPLLLKVQPTSKSHSSRSNLPQGQTLFASILGPT